MLKECIRVFETVLLKEQQKGHDLVLDSYIPSDGTYILVKPNGEMREPVDIKLNKKTREIEISDSQYLDKIKFYDFHSQLVSMNKPIDTKKVIHSNNCYSFFVKKDSIKSGKLTDEIIDGYYEVLKDPLNKKYKKSKETSNIYSQYEEMNGAVPLSDLELNHQWIKKHIFTFDGIDLDKKEYIKIFFETENENLIREDKRYLLPNIYNSNEYNVVLDNEIFGIPDNNMGMNAKKPYLENKSKKVVVPYLLSGDEVIFQRLFFQYLLNLASAGKLDIYIDTVNDEIHACRPSENPGDISGGYYLSVRKGKELEIQYQDNIIGYHQDLIIPFEFKNIAEFKHDIHPEYSTKYCTYYTRYELGHLISEVLFSNFLENTFYINNEDISITDTLIKNSVIQSKNLIFSWIKLGVDHGFYVILKRVSLNLIRSAILNGYRERAIWQLNLKWSLDQYFAEGGNQMMTCKREIVNRVNQKVLSLEDENWFENDDEYYYAVGQLAAYLISLNKSKNISQSLINPFLNANKDSVIKQRLQQLYKKYNYDIKCTNRRVKRMISLVTEYTPTEKVNQEMVMFGYANNNVVYQKEDNRNE